MKTIVLFGLVLGVLSAAGKVFIGEVGGKVTLQCGVSSFSNRVEWHHDKLIFKFMKKGFPGKGSSTISQRARRIGETDMEILSIIESDSGKFTCAPDGSRHEHRLIVVSASVVPSGPLKVGTEATLECKTNSGVSDQPDPEIKWQKPDGSIQTKHRVELKPVASSDKGIWRCLVSYKGENYIKNETINVEENVPKTTIPALVENSKSSNSGNGNGKNSTGGDRESGGPLQLLGLAWWIWAAIGAGSLVVIILIIVIIVVHKRNKRRKNKFLRMKKAQLAQKPKTYCQCVRQTAATKPQQGRRREKPSALPLQPLLQE